MTAGSFIRQQAKFRGWVEPGAAPSRYHLYVALACPWSHRAVIVRKLAGVDIGISYAHPYRDERGWRLMTDVVNGFEYLAEAYRETDPGYGGRISVPVLWDKETEVIVSNESADIVRMLDAWGDGTLYPEEQRDEIEALNEWIYAGLQNGVYRAGFARTQEAYDEAFDGVFETLGRLEASTTRTSSATAGGSSTTRTCGAIRASSISSPAWPTPSPWTRSASTTTRRTTR